MKKSSVILSGYTVDRKPVISGAFWFVGTKGIPLEIVLDDFQRKGYVVDWPDYIEGCLRDGHHERTIKSRILAAVGDVYGGEYRKGFQESMEKYFDTRSSVFAEFTQLH